MAEICTGDGPAWVALPDDESLPSGGRGYLDHGGCAHAVCPRGSAPGRKNRRADRP